VNLSGVMQRLPKIATRGKQNPNLVIGKWRSSRQPQEVQYSTCPPPVNGSRQWVVGQFESGTMADHPFGQTTFRVGRYTAK